MTSEDRTAVLALLRRVTFGMPPEEAGRYVSLGYRGTVDALIEEARGDDRDLDAYLGTLELDLTTLAGLQRWWLVRMLRTRRHLLERMVLFWHGVLVSASAKVGVPRATPEMPNPPRHLLVQNQLFRALGLGQSRDLYRAIVHDGAMLIYLDGRDSRKAKPNENFARELFELFAIGRSGPDGRPTFHEDDVREASRGFTGWSVSKDGEVQFRPNQFDAGTKRVFGQVGAFGADALIDLTLSHPNHAVHLCRRLFRHVIDDRPTEGDLAPVIAAYRESGGDMARTVRALLLSPAAMDPARFRGRMRSPIEFVVGTLRTLGMPDTGTNLPGILDRMGQSPFNPPNVAGWPSGERWLSPSMWLERVNFANGVATTRKGARSDGLPIAAIVPPAARVSPEAVVDAITARLLDGRLSSEARATLVAYARQGVTWPSGRTPRDDELAIDRKARGVIHLVLAMPDSHLA